MKILFVVPGGQDLGGIITSTEQYVAGLKEAGNEVQFMTVGFNTTPTRANRPPAGKFANDFTPGPGTGELYHTSQGWRQEFRLSLMNPHERTEFIILAKQFDVIIWASMYGFRNPQTEGSMEWTEIFPKLKGKHIFMIHDDHIRDRYPWGFALAKYARAYIGVQPCSYDSLLGVNAPRGMVYTPLPPLPKQISPVDARSGYFMCQVWKGWKRGDRLVAAAPLMPKRSVTFAGDGISLRYLRSPDKCPPRWAGLWDAAMAKQNYVGVLDEPTRDKYLNKAKFLVDLSTRNNSGQLNRIVQEAMAAGCVVIANPVFIPGQLFQPWVHYLPIDSMVSTEDLAKSLKYFDTLNWNYGGYSKMQKEARKVLKVFERKSLAEQLLQTFPHDAPDNALAKQAVKSFESIFGGKP